MEGNKNYAEFLGAFDEGPIVDDEDLLTEEEIKNAKEIV